MAPRTKKEIYNILKEDMSNDLTELFTSHSTEFAGEYVQPLGELFPAVGKLALNPDPDNNDYIYSLAFDDIPGMDGTYIRAFQVKDRKGYKKLREQSKKIIERYKADIGKAFEELKEGNAYTDEEIEYAKDYITRINVGCVERSARGYGLKFFKRHCILGNGLQPLIQNSNRKISDLMMDGLRMEKHGLPFSGVVIGVDKILNTMTDYIEEKEKGQMSPAESIKLRDQLLKQIEETLPMAEKLAKTNSFGKEVQVMDKFFGKADGVDPAETLNERYERGTAVILYSMTGMQAGLRNGWPIEDLNMLATFTYGVKAARINALIDRQPHSQKPKNKAEYKPGQEEFLSECDKLIEQLQNTPLKTEDQRKKLIEKIGELTQTAKKQGFLDEYLIKALSEDVESSREHRLDKTPIVFSSDPEDALKRFNKARAGIFKAETDEHKKLRKEAEEFCRLKRALDGDENSNPENKTIDELKEDIRASAKRLKKLADKYIEKKDKVPGTPAGVARLYGAAELKMSADMVVRDLDKKPVYPTVELDPQPFDRDEVIPDEVQKQIDEMAEKRAELAPIREKQRQKRKEEHDQRVKAAEEKRKAAEAKKKKSKKQAEKPVPDKAKTVGKKMPAQEYVDKNAGLDVMLKLPNIDADYMKTSKLVYAAQIVTREYFRNHRELLEADNPAVSPKVFENKLKSEQAFKNVIEQYSGEQLVEMANANTLISKVLKEDMIINPVQENREPPKIMNNGQSKKNNEQPEINNEQDKTTEKNKTNGIHV